MPQRLAALAAASALGAEVEPAPMPVDGGVVPAAPPVVLGLVEVPLLDVVSPVVPVPAVPPVVPVPLGVVVVLEVDELVSVLVPVAASSRRWQAVREAAAISAMVLIWASLRRFMVWSL